MGKLKLTKDEIVLLSQFRPNSLITNAVMWGCKEDEESKIRSFIDGLKGKDPILEGERVFYNYCHSWEFKNESEITPEMIKNWKKEIIKGEPIEGVHEVICGTSYWRAELWKEKRLGFVWANNVASKTGEFLGLQVACPEITKCRTERERLEYYAKNQASKLGDKPVILKFKTNDLYCQDNGGEFFVPITAGCWDFSIQGV